MIPIDICGFICTSFKFLPALPCKLYEVPLGDLSDVVWKYHDLASFVQKSQKYLVITFDSLNLQGGKCVIVLRRWDKL